MVYYDVQLLVSLDGEQSWQPAVQGNFPSGGIEITLPYPDGTDSKNYDFVVAHMITRAMNGKTPGEIEFPDIQETESGITFRVYSLSPISVGWKKVASGENPGGGTEETMPGATEETTQGVSTEPETEAEIVVSPSTGNNNGILVYSIMLISIMVMVGVVIRKK